MHMPISCQKSSLETNLFYDDGYLRIVAVIINDENPRWWLNASAQDLPVGSLGASRIYTNMQPQQFAVLRAVIETVQDLYRNAYGIENGLILETPQEAQCA